MKRLLIVLCILWAPTCYGFDPNGLVTYEGDISSASGYVILDVSQDLTDKIDSGRTEYATFINVYNAGKYNLCVESNINGSTWTDPEELGAKANREITSTGLKKVRLSANGNPTTYKISAYSSYMGNSRFTPGDKQVFIVDNDTEIIDNFFAETLGNFLVAQDTVASGLTAATLVYTFEAVVGHGLLAGDEVLLIATDRSLYAVVITAGTTTIEIDRPIDFVYPAGIGLEINTNMAVDGSVTPRIFKLRAGITPIFLRRSILTMITEDEADDTTFGDLPELTRGLVFRYVNGIQKTQYNWKKNGDFAQWAFDLSYTPANKKSEYGVRTRLTWGGLDKHGVVYELEGDAEAQYVVQDDLTGLVEIRAVAEGNKR